MASPPSGRPLSRDRSGTAEVMKDRALTTRSTIVEKAQNIKISGFSSIWRERISRDAKLWKPMTLRAPILGALIIVSITLIAVIEVLSHISSRDNNANGGGVVFAPTVDELSVRAKFGYLYFPTIVAVLYSLIWSWVDLDTKRLEPWFQLSALGGATGNNSLLLQYPFDFMPFVPITAAHRRHWRVVFSGAGMLMVFWVLTPFQSSVFTTGVVVRSSSIEIGTSAQLRPATEQNTTLTNKFLKSAYGVAWLNQSTPQFTTKKYAVLPFQATDKSSNTRLTGETWTTSTEVYSTTLDCTPASGIYEAKLGEKYTFDNGRGCVFSYKIPSQSLSEGAFTLSLIGYRKDYDGESLQDLNCTKDHADNFLAVWLDRTLENADGSLKKLVAAFCAPRYHIDNAMVTIEASTGAVKDVSVTERISRPIISQFNTTIFEYMIASGTIPTSFVDSSGYDPSLNMDVLEDGPVSHRPRVVQSYNITSTSSTVGLALGLTLPAIQDLSFPGRLKELFEPAFQLLFTSVFNELTVPINSTILENPRSAVRRDTPGAIILVRPIAIVVEVGLALTIVLACCLWYSSSRNPLLLYKDPASIADTMAAQSEKNVLDSLKGTNKVTIATLRETIGLNRYRLNDDKQGQTSLELMTLDSPQNQVLHGIFRSTSTINKMVTPVQPAELRLVAGAIFISIIAGGVTGIAILYRLSSEREGLTLLSKKQIVRSLLENYIPTLFATLLEPTWVILNRLLCLLLPFDELRKGNATPSLSIEAKYTSLPPQLTLWRSLRAGNFLLASVCIATLSTNILAVSLSALFTEKKVPRPFEFASKQYLIPRISEYNEAEFGYSEDQYYATLANLSHGTMLPPWSDNTSFYIPFDLTNVPEALRRNSEGTMGHTLGFSIEPTCVEVFPVENKTTIALQVDTNGVILDPSTVTPKTMTINCTSPISTVQGGHIAIPVTDPIYPLSPSNRSALVKASVLRAANVISANKTDICATIVITGWARIDGQPGPKQYTVPKTPRNISSTWVACTQELRLARYNITVDHKGHILGSTRIGNYIEDTAPFITNGSSAADLLMFSANTIKGHYSDREFDWHNKSISTNWISSFITLIQKSKDSVDPSKPPPKSRDVIPIMHTLYKQLFATTLAVYPGNVNTTVDPTPFMIQSYAKETRIFVSPTNFKISLTVIVLNLLVAIAYYAMRPKPFLPRMPNNIGSVMAYLSGSSAGEDFMRHGSEKGAMRREKPEDERYGYGRFVGTDGKPHEGIERQRYIVGPTSTGLLSKVSTGLRSRTFAWRTKN